MTLCQTRDLDYSSLLYLVPYVYKDWLAKIHKACHLFPEGMVDRYEAVLYSNMLHDPWELWSYIVLKWRYIVLLSDDPAAQLYWDVEWAGHNDWSGIDLERSWGRARPSAVNVRNDVQEGWDEAHRVQDHGLHGWPTFVSAMGEAAEMPIGCSGMKVKLLKLVMSTFSREEPRAAENHGTV